jgi:ectoine hydroxylase-related dioxygenase (phytanoyl-CoA dioxygenase family)
MLSDAQIDQFWRNGYLVAPNGVTASQLERLRQEVAAWVEESRRHRAPFGPPTIDGRPRFDMGEEHSADRPALRRVNNPSDISAAYMEVVKSSAMTDMAADLIGPDVKFHHCKINLKLPGTNTEVGYHQDFAYTPHTNDDLVTCLLMLDDMTLENGCLKVIPGSHRGPLYSLYEGERFTGAVDPAVERRFKPEEVAVTGRAGSVCFMHTCLLHGSDANRSAQSRGLYICVMSAADAFPLSRNVMANPNEGMILRGHPTRIARLEARDIELPIAYKQASFFAVQGQRSASAGGLG